MERRRFGPTELRISPLVLHCSWQLDEAELFRLLDRFIELGGNALYIPHSYFDDYSIHTAIGGWLSARKIRDQVILIQATRHQSAIRESLEEDLARLATDYVDVGLSLTPPTSRAIQHVLEEYRRTHECGMIRSLAISAAKYAPNQVSEVLQATKSSPAIKCCGIFVNYDLWHRVEYEIEYRAIVHEERLGVIACPDPDLLEYLLDVSMRELTTEKAGAVDETRTEVSSSLEDRALSMFTAISEAASELGATPAQVGLAWILSRPAIAGVLLSIQSEAQLHEFAEGARLKLGTEILTRLDEATAIDEGRLEARTRAKEQSRRRILLDRDKWSL